MPRLARKYLKSTYYHIIVQGISSIISKAKTFCKPKIGIKLFGGLNLRMIMRRDNKSLINIRTSTIAKSVTLKPRQQFAD